MTVTHSPIRDELPCFKCCNLAEQAEVEMSCLYSLEWVKLQNTRSFVSHDDKSVAFSLEHDVNIHILNCRC